MMAAPMSDMTNFLLVGVGGQGILTASDIVAEVGLAIGLAEQGTVDVLLAFETLEAARWIDWLRPGGTVLVNRQRIMPMSVSAGDAAYPGDEAIQAALAQRAGADRVSFVEGLAIAERLGNPRLANTALLGALSAAMEIDPAVWLAVVERRVPSKYVELNRAAFWEGRGSLPVGE
jgi:indolepyruvate ferredoxin oxidoreductase beta subunit